MLNSDDSLLLLARRPHRWWWLGLDGVQAPGQNAGGGFENGSGGGPLGADRVRCCVFGDNASLKNVRWTVSICSETHRTRCLDVSTYCAPSGGFCFTRPPPLSACNYELLTPQQRLKRGCLLIQTCPISCENEHRPARSKH